MKRGLLWMGALLVVATGCRAPRGGAETGAASSEQAVVQYLAGVRAEDLQAISTVWGNSESPTRDRIDRQELERRLLIVICHLRHDESRIGASQRGEAGRTVHAVELVVGGQSATVPFTTVRNAQNGRWYVEDVDLRPAREFCRAGRA